MRSCVPQRNGWVQDRRWLRPLDPLVFLSILALAIVACGQPKAPTGESSTLTLASPTATPTPTPKLVMPERAVTPTPRRNSGDEMIALALKLITLRSMVANGQGYAGIDNDIEEAHLKFRELWDQASEEERQRVIEELQKALGFR